MRAARGESSSAPDAWQADLISSRLLACEVWHRIHAKGLAQSHGPDIRRFLRGIRLLELEANILERATEPFPVHARTLDAPHLASMEYLRSERRALELASYDNRLIAAALALRIDIAPL